MSKILLESVGVVAVGGVVIGKNGGKAGREEWGEKVKRNL